MSPSWPIGTMFGMGQLDPDDSRAPYLQVANAYRRVIQNGDLKPGDRLPTHSQVMAEYGVSIGVVKRAYGVLLAEGFIVSRQGQGAFVRTHRPDVPEAPSAREVAEIWAQLADFGRRLDALEQRTAEDQ